MAPQPPMRNGQVPNVVSALLGQLMEREGGYVDNPADRGGPTKYGITEKTARRNGYKGGMKDLPRGKAFDILLNEYWLEPGFDKVAEIDLPIAAELLDTGTLCGPHRAGVFLQRILNVSNHEEKFWFDIKVDGQVGPETVSSLSAFVEKRGDKALEVVLTSLNALLGTFLLELAERDPTQQRFYFGWVYHRVIKPAYVADDPDHSKG